MDCTDGKGRSADTGRQADGGSEYMRGEEVKSVLNNDDRYVIGKDRR